MLRTIGRILATIGQHLAFVLTQFGGANGAHSQDPSARTLYEKPKDYRP